MTACHSSSVSIKTCIWARHVTSCAVPFCGSSEVHRVLRAVIAMVTIELLSAYYPMQQPPELGMSGEDLRHKTYRRDFGVPITALVLVKYINVFLLLTLTLVSHHIAMS
ncbi:hypothetical protein PYW08_007527 [Mythimna loreyi]|uniref:Uncharacterized protein n=1 Tax=Mythimna loreyi TaxID=667449 RepID=A0ACC2QH11_9NEOP|nr:hypothetical protein PYW08_007527 [Mythimna loreyi]